MLLTILKTFLFIIIAIILLVIVYIQFHPTFGGTPDASSQQKIAQSNNYNGKYKRFKNLIDSNATTIAIDKSDKDRDIDRISLIKNFLFPPKGKNPQQPLTTQPLNLDTLANNEFVWLGHSTVLFKTADTTIITDPVFYNASPVPFTIQPFAMTNPPTIDDLPFIDAVLISHDHYDHLDHKSIKKIMNKVGHFYVPLGVKAHLLRWGVADNNISEYDWYEQTKINDIQLTLTPTRHFSGRGLNDRLTTLWGSWAVVAPDVKVYFSGDGGYSPEFAKIGQKFDGFDIAFVENGAYNVSWQDMHMLPEQSAQAGVDLQAKVVLPIHWSKFDLSTHRWQEPVERISKAIDGHNETLADDKKIQLTTPKIGQLFSLNNLPSSKWWQEE